MSCKFHLVGIIIDQVISLPFCGVFEMNDPKRSEVKTLSMHQKTASPIPWIKRNNIFNGCVGSEGPIRGASDIVVNRFMMRILSVLILFTLFGS